MKRKAYLPRMDGNCIIYLFKCKFNQEGLFLNRVIQHSMLCKSIHTQQTKRKEMRKQNIGKKLCNIILHKIRGNQYLLGRVCLI